jgi:hypothetical protein
MFISSRYRCDFAEADAIKPGPGRPPDREGGHPPNVSIRRRTCSMFRDRANSPQFYRPAARSRDHLPRTLYWVSQDFGKFRHGSASVSRGGGDDVYRSRDPACIGNTPNCQGGHPPIASARPVRRQDKIAPNRSQCLDAKSLIL